MAARTDTERLAVIEEIVSDIKHRLFGNGQPGELEFLHGRVSKVDVRVDRLENWQWWVMGIGLGVGVAGGAVGVKVLELFR